MQITDANASEEHIFPNAIGGRKTVREFICEPCNNDTGRKWDAELARQLLPFCALLDIKRPRGANQFFTVEGIDGTKLYYHPDGSLSRAVPTYETNESNGRVEMNISARTFEELKGMIPGIARRYPKLSQEKMLHMATRSKVPSPPFRFDFNFGGVKTGKSVIKTCLAMIHSYGLNIDQCEHVQSYLFGSGEPCFGYFNKRDLVRNRPRQTFFHCVWIRGDSLQKQIVAYVEYFGVQRIVACLSSKYSGKDFSCGYAIDPVTGKDLDLEVDIDISSDEIRRIYDYKMVDTDITKRALEAFLGSWVEMDRQRVDRTINDIINHALSECGISSLSMLTSENIRKFSAVAAKRFTEWTFPGLRE